MLKKLVALLVGLAVFGSQLELPSPWGPLISSVVGTLAYLASHDKLFGIDVPAGKGGQRGFIRLGAAYVLVLLFAIGFVVIGYLSACQSAVSQAQCRAQTVRAVQTARALCVAYHSQRHPDDGIAVVADKFCASADQLAPFAEAGCDVAAALSEPDAGR